VQKLSQCDANPCTKFETTLSTESSGQRHEIQHFVTFSISIFLADQTLMDFDTYVAKIRVIAHYFF